LVEWWEPDTKKKYLEKAKCIIEQYGNYTEEETGMHVSSNPHRCTVKLTNYLCKNYTMKMYIEVGVQHHTFLNLELDGEWAASHSGCITPGQKTPVRNGQEAE